MHKISEIIKGLSSDFKQQIIQAGLKKEIKRARETGIEVNQLKDLTGLSSQTIRKHLNLLLSYGQIYFEHNPTTSAKRYFMPLDLLNQMQPQYLRCPGYRYEIETKNFEGRNQFVMTQIRTTGNMEITRRTLTIPVEDGEDVMMFLAQCVGEYDRLKAIKKKAQY